MIIVTGAAGLIGSAVVREFNRRGVSDLVLVDHLGSSEKWKNLRSLNYQDYFEKDEFRERLLFALEHDEQLISSSQPRPGQTGAVASSAALGLANDQIEAIVHLGANSSTTVTDASHLMENNYRYSVELAEFAMRHGIRMVYASSAATYGDGARGFEDSLEILPQLRPLNAYGHSKQMFDQYLATRNFPANFAGLKYFNVYGPNEYHKGDMRSVILKSFEQILEKGSIGLFKSYHPEYKDGEQMRDFLYVEDAAKMTVHFVLDNVQASGLFNLGSGIANTWNTLANAIFSAMNREPQIHYIEMPEHMRSKYQYYTCAPIDRLRGANYTVEVTSVQSAVKDYVQTYLMPGQVNA